MKRREFMQLTGLTGAMFAPTVVSFPEAYATPAAEASGPDSVLDGNGLIAGRTIDDLIARYRYDLFDDFLPFMDAHVIDHELGGFMTTADRSGKTVSTEKRTWFEGRGIWVYSHLYRTLAPEDRYLEVARKSVDFMLRAQAGRRRAVAQFDDPRRRGDGGPGGAHRGQTVSHRGPGVRRLVRGRRFYGVRPRHGQARVSRSSRRHSLPLRETV